MRSSQQGSAGVGALVASIKQHKKFKQLAGYSVNALVKAIVPPAVGWEKNLKEAYEAGALEAITEVLTKHSGDEEVTAAATAALTAIASDGSYATAVVETGAMMGLVGSVVANPNLKKGVRETIALFEKVASTAPRAVLAAGGVDAATRLIELVPHDKDITPACLRVLDHLVKEPEGAATLVECDTIKQLMGILDKGRAGDGDLLETTLRVLDRVCKVGEYADSVRTTHKGVEVLCSVLSRQATDSKASALGGRLLAKLAAASVSDLVAKMLAAPTPTEREFLASLLANLALEGEFSEKILQSGGLPALSQVLGSSASSKTSEAAARALSRLVSTEAHATQLLGSDIVPRLVGLLTAGAEGGGGGDAASLAAAVTSALARIATRSMPCASAVVDQGGLAAIIAHLQSHPTLQAFAMFALNLLEDAMTMDGEGHPSAGVGGVSYPWVDAGGLVSGGAIEAVCGALRAHPGHPAIQLNGVRVLVYLSLCEANVGRMSEGGVVPAVLLNLATPPSAASGGELEGMGGGGAGAGAGAAAGAASASSKPPAYTEPTPELVAASMYLMTQFALTGKGKGAIGIPGGEAIMSAVSHFTRVMGSLGEEGAVGSISLVAEDLMLAVVSEAQVLASLKDLRKLTDSASDTRSKVEVSKLRALATNISAYAATPQFAGIMLRSGALEALLHTINAVSSTSGLPDAERVLVACAGALQGTLRSVEASGEGGGVEKGGSSKGSTQPSIAALAEAGGGKILSTAIKAAPRMLRFCSEAMGLLAYMSQDEELGDQIAGQDGGVEACCAVLRANPVNGASISSDALATLAALGSTDNGALAVAKLGGTRAVIAAIHGNVGDAVFAREALGRAMDLLSRVAMTGEGSELLVRQGGVDALVEAAAEIERYAEPGSQSAKQAEDTLASLVGILGRLMGKEEVRKTAEGVKALAASSSSGIALTTDALRTALIKLPVIAGVPAFAAIVGGAGVPSALLSINAQLLEPGFDPAAATSGLELTFKSLSALSKAPGGGGLGGVNPLPLLTQAIAGLRSGVAIVPCLDFIRSLTASNETLAAHLALDKTTLPLIATTLKGAITDKEVSGAAFRAMAALGGHASTSSALLSTPALALASEWLLDNAGDAGEESVGSALSVLASLASNAEKGGGEAVVNAGVLDTVRHVLALRCSGGGGEGSPPAPTVMASSLRVLSAVAGMEASIASRLGNSSGLVKRSIGALNAHRKAYLSTETTALRVCEFVGKAAGLGGEVGRELSEEGAVELVLAAMSANFTSPEVLEAGGAALVALGGGEDAARLALSELKTLAATCSPSDESALRALGDAASRLSNLAVIPGVVSPTTTTELLTSLGDTLDILTASPVAPTGALGAVLQALGRVMELGGEAGDGVGGRCVQAMIDALNCRRAANVSVRMAGVHALGQAVSCRAGAEAVIKSGGLKVVTDAAKKHHADAKLQAIAAATTKRISSAATKYASSVLTTPEGIASLAALLNAHGGDPDALGTVLGDILGSQGGEEALLAVVAGKSVSGDVLAAVLTAVAEEGGGLEAGGGKKGATPGRVAALIAALEAAMALQATLTVKSDGKSKWRALQVASSALKVLARTTWCKKTGGEFLQKGGGDVLMQLLAANRDDPETVAAVCGIVAELTSAGVDPSDLDVLLPHVRLMADVLRDAIAAKMDPLVAANALKAIVNLTSHVPEGERGGYEKEVMRCSALLARTYPGNAGVLSSLRALEGAWGKKVTNSGDAEKHFGVSVSGLRALFERAGKWQEVVGGDGRRYYFNPDTGETLWECPPDLLAAKAALKALAECASVMGEDSAVDDADPATIAELVAAVDKHARSPDLVCPIASTLATLAINPSNAEKVVDAGGILGLAKVCTAFPDNLDLLRTALRLMERCSLLEAYRLPVAEKGGLDLILLVAIGRHSQHEDIAILSLTIMAQLAVSPEVVDLTMEKKGVKSVEKCLQVHREGPRVLEPAMSVLSNLMYGNETNKLEIGQTCGDEITGVVKDHCKDAALTKTALRALGNLTFCMDNVRFVVEEHAATKAIVAAMRTQASDEDVQVLAMTVLSNCAAVEEPPPELDEHGDPVGTPPDSIPLIILREAGCSQVIGNLKRFRNSPRIVLDSLACLTNLAIDAEVSEKMVKKQKLLDEVMEVVRMYHMDVEVLSRAFGLLGQLSFSRECLVPLVEGGFLPLLISHMEAHTDEPELLAGAQQTIGNMVSCYEGRDAVRDLNAVPNLMGLLEAGLDTEVFVREAMTTIMRLCAESDLSLAMASSSMHIIMSVFTRYDEDARLLILAFKALGALAFEKTNLSAIVQHNGIQRIISAITMHPDNKELMKSCIQSLDNISMASSENASIAIDEGGKELLELVMESHKDTPEIQRCGKSALLSMSALEGLVRAGNITQRAARNKSKGAAVEREDPLKEFRNQLSAGKIFKVWEGGSSRTAHIVMSSDFRSIVWQEVGTTRKLGAMELRSVLSVRAGTGDSKNFKRSMLSVMSTKVNPDLAFSVVGDHHNLDLEANTLPDKDKWIKALGKVVEVYKTNPSLLAPV